MLGLALGYGVGALQNWSERDKLSQRRSLTSVALALALLSLAAMRLMGANGILAVFAGATGFHWVTRRKLKREQDEMHDVLEVYFQLPAFVLLGMMVPWHAWGELGLAGLACTGAILFVRRLPALLLLKSAIPAMTSWKEAIFLGWFGPMGVASLFYASMAQHRLHEDRVWIMTSQVIVASILVHGVTSLPFTRLLLGSAEEADEPRPMEADYKATERDD